MDFDLFNSTKVSDIYSIFFHSELSKNHLLYYHIQFFRLIAMGLRGHSVVKQEAGKLAPLNKFGIAVFVHANRTATGVLTFLD